MMKKCNNGNGAIEELIKKVKDLITDYHFDDAYKTIVDAMRDYPDCAVPHNLLGIYYEKINIHSKAMNHFRAANSLDPTYRPARENLNIFGTFLNKRQPCYDDSDFEQISENEYCVIYDERGIGHIL